MSDAPRMPLWTAHLDPHSPRYADWKKIFLDSDEVKISSPLPFKATLGAEQTRVYAIRIGDMNAETLARLMTSIAERFGVSEEAVKQQIETDAHFPIREEDVIVAFSSRAFI